MVWLRNFFMIVGAFPALVLLAAVELAAAKTFGIAKLPQNLVGYFSFFFGIFICVFLIWIIAL